MAGSLGRIRPFSVELRVVRRVQWRGGGAQSYSPYFKRPPTKPVCVHGGAQPTMERADAPAERSHL
jgi:hypothetical protein